MQAIGVKTTVTINSDPNAGKGGASSAPPPPAPPTAPDGETGKASLIVEEGRGKTSVTIDEAPAAGMGTVVAEGSTLQPPLGNTRIHIQEGAQVQEIRDTRTRVRIHETMSQGTVIGKGVVMHPQAASSDPHGRTRVSIVEPAQRLGAEGTTVVEHRAPALPPPAPPALASEETLSKKPRMRGARGGRRSKKKVAKKKLASKAKARD